MRSCASIICWRNRAITRRCPATSFPRSTTRSEATSCNSVVAPRWPGDLVTRVAPTHVRVPERATFLHEEAVLPLGHDRSVTARELVVYAVAVRRRLHVLLARRAEGPRPRDDEGGARAVLADVVRRRDRSRRRYP